MKRIKSLQVAILSTALSLSAVLGATAPSLSMSEVKASADDWSRGIEAMTEDRDYVEGEAIVCIREGDKKSLKRALSSEKGSASTEELMQLSGANRSPIKKTPSALGSPATDRRAIERSAGADGAPSEGGSLVIVRDHSKSTKELLGELAKDDSVVFAEPNYVYSQAADSRTVERSTVNDSASGESYISANASAGDGSSMQYAYSTEGAHLSDARTGMNIPNWNKPAGNMSRDVIVAVMDTGVDWTHPDLTDRVVKLSEYQQKALGCGERGYDACSFESGDAMDDPEFVQEKLNLHGTHCAGIIAASWDGKGTSGAASRAKILPIKIDEGKADGCSTTDAFLRGLSFVKRGRQLEGNPIQTEILSISWAMDTTGRSIYTAVKDLGESCGVLTCFAAGNDGERQYNKADMTYNLQTNPYAVIVGATDISDKITAFSNYGNPGDDVGAPGSNILSTIPQGFGEYIPSLAPEGTNAAFWGAEQSADITISMTDESGRVIGTGSPSSMRSFSGKKSYRIVPGREIEEGERITITSNPTDLSSRIEAGDDYSATFAIFADGMFNQDENEQKDAVQVKTKSGWRTFSSGFALYGGNWVLVGNTLPKDTDYNNFQIKISLTASEACDTDFCLDEFGIGTKRTSYTFLDGTSMATPAAAGAAAVLASKYSGPEACDPKQLKADLIGSSHFVQSLEGIINNSGVVDLSVSEDDYGPYISSVAAKASGSGTDITIEGYHLGDSDMSCTASMISGGKQSEVPINTVKSQSEKRAVFHTDRSLSKTGGVLMFTLKKEDGRQYTAKCAVKKSSEVFENDYDIPVTYDDEYRLDAFEDYESTGTMLGLGNSLIYLQDSFNDEKSLYTHKIWKYDLIEDPSRSRWSGFDMKEPLMYVSAVTYDDRILLEGATMNVMAYGVPYASEYARERIYLFDPKTKTWTEENSEDVTLNASIVNINGKLYTVDYDYETETSGVYNYDFRTGRGSLVTTLESVVVNPEVAVLDGRIYITSPNSVEEPVSFQVVDGKTCTDYTDKVPKYGYNIAYTTRKLSIAAISDGIVMAGPYDQDNNTATWLFNPKTGEFAPYKKQIADDSVLGVTLCGYNGQLWAMLSEAYDTTGEKTAFRSTSADTPYYSLTDAKFTCRAAAYTGKKITPKNAKVTIKKANGKTVDITKYVDISYSDNINPGKAKVSIKAKSGQLLYQGSTTGSFTIERAASAVKLTLSPKSAKKGESIRIKATKTNGQKISYAVPKKAKGISVTKAGKLTVSKKAKKGTYKVTVKAGQTKNYKAKTMKVTVKVMGGTYSVSK